MQCGKKKSLLDHLVGAGEQPGRMSMSSAVLRVITNFESRWSLHFTRVSATQHPAELHRRPAAPQ
jgi:hypothetical protein